MSILIKGMKMPKTCYDCIFYESLECVLTGFDADRKDRHCPLIELPPHGRLIDADALWVEINKICDRRDAEIISDLTCLQQILSAVRHAPAIIEAEDNNGADSE